MTFIGSDISIKTSPDRIIGDKPLLFQGVLSQCMIFIGYELGSKAYRVYDPVTKKVHVSRGIVFDEQAEWDKNIGGEHGEQTDDDDTFIMEMEYSTVTEVHHQLTTERVHLQRHHQLVRPSPFPDHLHQLRSIDWERRIGSGAGVIVGCV
jgi:hypothetical protein